MAEPTGTTGPTPTAGVAEGIRFKRSFVLPEVVMTTAELGAAAWAYSLLQVKDAPPASLAGVGGALGAVFLAAWLATLSVWLTPIQRVVTARRSGGSVDDATRRRALRNLDWLPLWALLFRTALWAIVAAAVGFILLRGGGWPRVRWPAAVSLVTMVAFVMAGVRAAWYSGLLNRLEEKIFDDIPRLERFAAGYFSRDLNAGLVAAAGALGAMATFVYYFLPISREEYLSVQTLLPSTMAAATLVWFLYARRVKRPIDAYIAVGLGEGPTPPKRVAVAAYRAAQALPYRLAGSKLVAWAMGAVVVATLARWSYRMSLEDAGVLLGSLVILSIGATLYEALWHRDAMRPLLQLLADRHALPLRQLRTPLGLRGKLLLAFGGLVLFACGLSLVWGFSQYREMAADFVQRQSRLKLDWIGTEVERLAMQAQATPTQQIAREVLEEAAQASSYDGAVYVLVPKGSHETVVVGGGPEGAPRLPWYAEAAIRAGVGGGVLTIDSVRLAGQYQELVVGEGAAARALGSVAVLYPGYRTGGGGPGIQRPLAELIAFFLVLLGVCAGIVGLTVAEFTQPIRLLEARADEMAQGELDEPVVAGAEGDEIGRLTSALEEMRRALKQRIEAEEEAKQNLEREVEFRTADLAKKNRELGEALDQLKYAQSQLIRSEKMASIGQLVAGIAHEINNPVNAISNTIGPLQDAVSDLAADSEAAGDVQHMIRVITRGAQRTKEIVQALHNYSRTDDERIGPVDLNRGLDDSLELLRHQLKGTVQVERDYGEVGRVEGNAGQLNQVFMNLLTNAAQALAGSDHGRIKVSTRRTGEQVVIRVEDNGPGIPKDVLPRIFDPFFTTKDVGEGTGLGLAIVHGIVERHGGTVEVESEVGKGTTFVVNLPSFTMGPAGRWYVPKKGGPPTAS